MKLRINPGGEDVKSKCANICRLVAAHDWSQAGLLFLARPDLDPRL
jgi:hypothetical protein